MSADPSNPAVSTAAEIEDLIHLAIEFRFREEPVPPAVQADLASYPAEEVKAAWDRVLFEAAQ